MWATLAKLASLQRHDVTLLLRAGAALAAARVSLSLWSFESVQQFVDRQRTTRGADGHSPEKIAWAIGAISRRVPGTTCLPQAVAALALLRRTGISAELRVGIARDSAGGVIGHAWVEHEGRVLIGETDTSYAPLSARRDRGDT